MKIRVKLDSIDVPIKRNFLSLLVADLEDMKIIRKVKRLRRVGKTIRDIAEASGLSLGYVHKILNNKLRTVKAAYCNGLLNKIMRELVFCRCIEVESVYAFGSVRSFLAVSALGLVLFLFSPTLGLGRAGSSELFPLRSAKFQGEEQQLCKLYLSVIEDAVDFFDPLWTEDLRVPNAGFFDFRKYDDWEIDWEPSYNYANIITIPGTGMVLLDYAVLLTETDKEIFGKLKLPRQVLLDRAVKAIRWCCLTSAYVENPYPFLPNTPKDLLSGKHWKRKLGRRVDEIGYLTLAVGKLWDYLDAETRRLFRRVATGGAQRTRLVRRWMLEQGGNHDQVKQDLSSTFGAAFLFGDKQEGDLFLAALTGNAIDMVSTVQDRTKDVLAEGKPVKEWARGWNLYEDYSSDHHGHANIWYGGDMLFEGRCYVDILAHLTGKKIPETFTYDGNGFDGVLEWLKVLCLAEGGLAHPHGAEYDSYYGAGLLAFCYGATVKKDRIAAALEQQTAKLLLRHTRAVQKYDYHRGSWAKAAMAYLMHKYYSPSAVPLKLEQALRSLDGTYHYPQQQCLIHRTPEKWVSFSWGSTSARQSGVGFCGIVDPQGRVEENDEPLVYCHPYSLTGILHTHSLIGAFRTSPLKHVLRRVVGGVMKEMSRILSAPSWVCGIIIVIIIFIAGSGLLYVYFSSAKIGRNRKRLIVCFGLILALPVCLLIALLIPQIQREATTEAILDVVYSSNRSDGAFTTTGRITQRDVQRYQAFFSFGEGPCITLTSIRALKDATISWSGLPVYLYVRPGVTGERMCYYEGGSAPTRELGDTESSWWCVNDKLGITTVGGTGRIRGGRAIGYNWARKDSYKDKCDFVAVSPLDRMKVKTEETVDIGAVIYVNLTHDEVRKCSRTVQDLSGQLPQGWKGLVAPISRIGGGRILAITNFYGQTAVTELRLSFPEGAPVLEEDTEIIRDEARSEILLSSLESLGETLDWYIEVTKGESLRARKIAFDRVELIPSDSQGCSIRIRYIGKKSEYILFKNTTGRVLKEVPTSHARFPAALEWHLSEPLVLQLHGKEIRDHIGPAVEIAAIEPQPNGMLRITAHADDRSGVRNVKLYCDDRLVGEDSVLPFEWTYKPGVGWHSFRAVATDASPNGNLSISFSRTAQVGQLQVGVFLDDAEAEYIRENGGNFFAGYIIEILSHAGIPHAKVTRYDVINDAILYPVLIIPYNTSFSINEYEIVRRYVENGGTLITLGGTSGLESILGVTPLSQEEEGFLQIFKDSDIYENLSIPLHVFSITPVQVTSAEPLAEVLVLDSNTTDVSVNKRLVSADQAACFSRNASTNRTGLTSITRNRYGSGESWYIGADLVGSIITIQQGIPVYEDGVPASDGTANINDGILKADDGCVLNWTIDRSYVEGDPLFLEPIADKLKELLIRIIFRAYAQNKACLPVLYYWPRSLDAVGVISNDTDYNVPVFAHNLLDRLRALGINSTWCFLQFPENYPVQIFIDVASEGHETAIHYDAQTADNPLTTWSEENFMAQLEWLRSISREKIVSCKTHYVRWEGWVDFYRWCEDAGIEAEQSKSGSKRGNLGFTFGTCHPFFPVENVEYNNRVINVLSINTLGWDVIIFAPYAHEIALIDKVVEHYGVAHFLLHPHHINRPGVSDAFADLVRYGRNAGLEWWTIDQVNKWERIRRQIVLDNIDHDSFRVYSPMQVPNATMYVVLGDGDQDIQILIDGVPVEWQSRKMYGVRTARFTLDLEMGYTHVVFE